MKTVINSITGKKLYDTPFDNVELGDDEELVSYFEEQKTLEEIDYQNKEQIKARYEQYKLDGWQAYQDFRADLVEQINKGDLTEALAFVIESYLSVAYDKIAQNGDWKTAYYKLSMLVIPNNHAFVLPYKNTALDIIQNYINENYPKK